MKIPASGELSGRSIAEWIGKTPDTPVPDHVQLRILLRQSRLCAIENRPRGIGEEFQCDHKIRLKDGGENRESNLQMILEARHKIKSAAERKAGKKVDRIQKKVLGIHRPKTRMRSRNSFQRNVPNVKYINNGE